MFRRKLILVLGLILAMPASSFAEPTVQASNIIFKNVAARSMRIIWTRGNGDGSIVILREDPPNSLVDPADGGDYTANPDYTLAPELSIGSQNFVVYQGTGSNLLISGLVASTSYSISIYEYDGIGATTDYLQLNPAEASQTTTNTPVHNDDNRIDCSDCHNHGTFGASDTELKAVCETCHNPSGVASAKLEFDNHTTPTKNTNIDFVDCGMCHELHNPVGGNTTESYNDVTDSTQNNKSFLRANVDKYVPTSSPPAYLHTDQPLRQDPHPDGNIPADNPDRAVEDGDDLTATGYCQVCHSKTDYHRSTDTGVSDQCHDGGSGNCGIAETHCGTCHEHNNKFDGAGDCVSCHSTPQGTVPLRPAITTQFDDRPSSHVSPLVGGVTQEDCLVCHDHITHQAKTVRMNDPDGGTNHSQPTVGGPTLGTGEGEAFAPACLGCHDVDGATRLAGGDPGQTPLSPFTDSPAPPVFDETAWTSGASHNRPVATSGSSPVTCMGDGTNGCHGSGHGSENNSLLAPADVAPDLLTTVPATVFCLVCHDSTGPSSFDIEAQFDTGTNFQVVASGGAAMNQRHDITRADQDYSSGAVTCKDCHRPHEDAPEEIVFVDTDYIVQNNPVGNPDTGDALGIYKPANHGGGLDPTFGATEPDYVEFCLACHDGAGGTSQAGSAVLSTDLVSIGTTYASDFHGEGSGGSGGNGFLKPPFTIDTAYAALQCTQCHGAHGSDNIFNLRSTITVGAGTASETIMSTGGPWASRGDMKDVIGTTYTLESANDGITQENRQWGAWCSFCHNLDQHSLDETKTCNSGHVHGGGKM